MTCTSTCEIVRRCRKGGRICDILSEKRKTQSVACLVPPLDVKKNRTKYVYLLVNIVPGGKIKQELVTAVLSRGKNLDGGAEV